MRPDIAVIASSILWGTLWIPIRQLNGTDWAQGTAITLSCLIATLALLPFMLKNRRYVQLATLDVWLMGALMGMGAALYFEGLIRGDVARIVLLFYLMPVWSAILGRIINGNAVTFQQLLGIFLGLAGMAVIFFEGANFPFPSSIAEFMAVISGVIWALAFTWSEKTKGSPLVMGRIFATMLMMCIFFYLLTLIPGSRNAAIVTGIANWELPAEFWLLTLGLIWFLPAMFLTLYGANQLQSTQVAIFLMIEVGISLASAALFLDEPFGMRETIGAALILGASLTEFTGFSRKKEEFP